MEMEMSTTFAQNVSKRRWNWTMRVRGNDKDMSTMDLETLKIIQIWQKRESFLKMLRKVVAKETLWIDPNRCNESQWGKCKKDTKVTRLCHLIHTIAQIIPFFYT